jgi:hypothetical protein
VIPERLITATEIVEAVLELQHMIATEGETDASRALHQRIALLVFEAEPTTLEGVVEVLNKIVSTQGTA